jgi:glycosyltransferase involved in cell wall biosynthesis
MTGDKAASELRQRDAGSVVMLLDNHFGPDLRVLREVELLAASGLDVTILAWDRRVERKPISVQLPPRVQVMRVHVPAPPGRGVRTAGPLFRFSTRVLRRHLQVLREAAVIVVHDIYLLPLVALLCRLLRVPLVYDAHEDFALTQLGYYPDRLVQMIERAESLLARSAAAIVVPGRVRQQRWTDAGFSPPIVLANIGPMSGVDGAGSDPEVDWDLVYCGRLADIRRPDLLVELARTRPDLRIAVAGAGSAASKVAERAGTLPNLSFMGWVEDPESLLRRARAVYYGLDPAEPYADSACPNNLYLAIRAERPLIFFCGGEPRQLATQYKIGIHIRPDVGELGRAVDAVASGNIQWEFARAWAAIESSETGRQYVEAIHAAIRAAGVSKRENLSGANAG